MDDIDCHNVQHDYPVSRYVDDNPTHDSHESSKSKESPQGKSYTCAMIFICETFFSPKPFMMFFVTLAKTENFSEFSMHERSMYIPFDKRIEKYATGDNNKRDDNMLENSHGNMIVIQL